MRDEAAAKDAELKRWLDEAFPVLGDSLSLPEGAVSAARSALQAIPVDDLMRWAEELGLDSSERIRLMAREVPDAAQRLATEKAQQKLWRWELSHQAAPVLKALGEAAQELAAYWRSGGVPRLAVVRLLAALALRPAVPGGDALRERLRWLLDADCGDAAGLIRQVARLAMTGEGYRLEQADGLIRQDPVMAQWLEGFLAALQAAALEPDSRGAVHSALPHSGLVGLLAELLQAALAWEEEHGPPTTSMPSMMYTGRQGESLD